MAKIIARNERAELVVDTEGGVIESYRLDTRDIFYPRQEIEGKMRGGCHVCAPNFGPGGNTDQPQHGYARTVEWEIISPELANSGEVVLAHQMITGEFAGLHLRLAYVLMDNKLQMSLTASNQSDRPLKIAPGFHPYFALPEDREGVVSFNSETYRTRDLEEAVFIASPNASNFVTIDDTQQFSLVSPLSVYALWTAHPDRYVCVEPTLAGYGFENGGEDVLEPAEVRRYTALIHS